MKLFYCCTILLFAALESWCQLARIDSLVRQLNNKEIKFEGSYIGPGYSIEDGPATELVKIGKPATARLLGVVRDTAKGVIAHLVLTQIWKGSLAERFYPIQIAREGITVFKANELYFFMKDEKEVFANESDLEAAYNVWDVSTNSRRR